MRTVCVLFFVLTTAAVAAARERLAWTVPEGADAAAVLERIRDVDHWPDVEGAEVFRKVVATSVYNCMPGRIDLYLSVHESDDLGILDEVFRRLYQQYRDARLPVLPALIELKKLELDRAEKAEAEVRAELVGLLESGAGVLDRKAALAGNVERSEELRRRAVDARIEKAVLEARLGALKRQILDRQEEVRRTREDRIRAMEEELQRLVKEKFLHTDNLKRGEHRDAIDRLKREPLPEDERLNSLLRMMTDFEVEKIGLEERVKVLGESIERERKRALRLLEAVDLEHFQKARLVVARDLVEADREDLARLERELAAVRKSETLHRVSLEAKTGRLPRVHVLGMVAKPGTYVVTGERITLSQVIALAGDFRRNADESRIRIIRSEEKRSVSLRVDFDDIIDQKIEDLVLQAGDIVYVPEQRGPNR
jgi:protein involved in polysaccharide export with SLBB domain